jgi:Zn-dependent peptidase ImmA (M78 family)/DNA-binding XRE family transcriptional regulator
VKFNPARLSVARKRRTLNKKRLADCIGVDQRTIVRWERCQSEPTSENLDALVKALNFPRPFFFGADIDEPINEYTSFRSQTSMSASERDAALAAGQIGFLVFDWIDQRFKLSEPTIPDLHLFAPESAAEMLRQDWGLGVKPVSNMIQLLESKGVKVFSLAENTAHVNAYSLWRKSVPYVFLNTFKSAECGRFDAAHELAHLVLHQDGGVTGRVAEEQANQFASAFLMPKGDVLSVLPKVKSLKHLIEGKVRWKVSLAALNYRVHKLGIINDWTNRVFCIEIAKKGYAKAEPNGIEREKSTAWEKVLKALWAEKTTQNDIASELNLPVDEVSDLLFGMLRPPTSNSADKQQPLSIFVYTEEVGQPEAYA